MTAPVDTLANVERAPSERPEPRRDEGRALPGYWLGSAAGEVRRWRDRALAAEARLAAIRAALTGWRPHT
jgi:hypothetical protein